MMPTPARFDGSPGVLAVESWASGACCLTPPMPVKLLSRNSSLHLAQPLQIHHQHQGAGQEGGGDEAVQPRGVVGGGGLQIADQVGAGEAAEVASGVDQPDRDRARAVPYAARNQAPETD